MRVLCGGTRAVWAFSRNDRANQSMNPQHHAEDSIYRISIANVSLLRTFN